MQRRFFHSTGTSFAKYYDVNISAKQASASVPIHSSINLKLYRLPYPSQDLPPQSPKRIEYIDYIKHKHSLRKFRESSVFWKETAVERAVVCLEKDGKQAVVPVPEWLDFYLEEGEKSTLVWEKRLDYLASQTVDCKFNLEDYLKKSETKEGEKDFLNLSLKCLDPNHRLQSRHWGFYRNRIAAYAQYLSAPQKLSIKLVGVGYRAAVEPLELKSRKDAELLEKWINRQTNLIERNNIRLLMAKNFTESIYGQMWQMQKYLNEDTSLWYSSRPSDQYKAWTKTHSNETISKPEIQKLVLKLGHSHSIETILPPWIECQIPQPTNIQLIGLEYRAMLHFAQSIRMHRPPEPYKGKGVFVGNETIALKQKKMK